LFVPVRRRRAGRQLRVAPEARREPTLEVEEHRDLGDPVLVQRQHVEPVSLVALLLVVPFIVCERKLAVRARG